MCRVFIFDIQTVISETPPKRDQICAAMCKLVYNVVGIFRVNKNVLIHNKIRISVIFRANKCNNMFVIFKLFIYLQHRYNSVADD